MAHEQQLITKRAWLGPGGPEGYLTVASASLKWQPAASGATGVQELRIPLSCITNNQRAKDKPLVRITFTNGTGGAAAHVFQFESVADRDAALDVLTKVIAAVAAAASGSGTAASGGGGGGDAGPAVAGGFTRQQRQQMVARDADLKALYDELVGGGVVGEADFWGGVAARLAAAKPASWGTAAAGPAGAGGLPGRRRLGLSNILQRVEAEVDGRHQRVLRVSLTPEQVAQIFAEQPAVLRAYREHVPHRMAEEDFWRRYVRHEMHKESKRKARAEGINPNAAAAGGGAMADDAGGDIFREAAAAVAAEAARRPGQAAAHREAVDPELDLAAAAAERYSGHGTAHAAARDPEMELAAGSGGGGSGGHHHPLAADPDPDDLAAAINKHGEVVLQGVEALARVEAQLKGTAPAAAGGHHGHHGHHQHNHHNHNHNHHRADGADPGPGSNGGDPHGEGQGGGGLLGRRRRRHSAGLEDLHEPPARQLDALSIADPRRYFERSGQQGGGAAPAAHMGGGWGGAGGGGGGGPGLSGAAAVLGCVSPGCLPLPPLQGCAAEEALLEATPLARALAEEEAAGPGGAATASGPGGASALLRDPASSVPPETLAFLRRTVLSVNEACRHLWRCLPANTPARRDKAGRLARLLESKRGEVEALNDRARGVEGRFIRQLLKPPMDMLLAALVRWDEEQQKRPAGAS
ncbi:hypothetical protein CHLRE_10g466550v5 [Chlamydomonas reinhardtii]|uniref:BSD domain-containing protein n=1 Tax=Chlamydomonas reinhardtii TaxID=3055 RepID=A0A2K3DCB3_CHLRE|nr:uncharacterized protein CHLRE_10g466550v5 [Chlamydomonas reinhardtii]PNW78163.1 hypothetical protein CHLRE_10g466550v5 [Chlamydomonas reinhardtii]